MLTWTMRNSLDFRFGLKAPIQKLNESDIPEGKTMRVYFSSKVRFKNIEIVVISKRYLLNVTF